MRMRWAIFSIRGWWWDSFNRDLNGKKLPSFNVVAMDYGDKDSNGQIQISREEIFIRGWWYKRFSPPCIIKWENSPHQVLCHPCCSQTSPTKHNPYEGLGLLEAHQRANVYTHINRYKTLNSTLYSLSQFLPHLWTQPPLQTRFCLHPARLCSWCCNATDHCKHCTRDGNGAQFLVGISY